MVFPAEPCGIVSMFGWADIVKSGVVAADVALARLPNGTAKTNPVNSMKRKNNFIGFLKISTYGTVQLLVAFFAGLNVSVVSVSKLSSFSMILTRGASVVFGIQFSSEHYCTPM
jgi:hypothetical protein